MVRRLEACKFDPLANPLGKFIEFECPIKDDSCAPIGEPSDLTLHRTKTLDNNGHLLADAIFIDRLDLHSPQRNVVNIDRIIDLAQSNRGFAGNFKSRRTRAEPQPWLTSCEKLTKINVLIELEPDKLIASSDHIRRNFLGRKFDLNVLPDFGCVAHDRHKPTGRHVLYLDQLLIARLVNQLPDPKHRCDSLILAPFGWTRHRDRKGNGRRLRTLHRFPRQRFRPTSCE